MGFSVGGFFKRVFSAAKKIIPVAIGYTVGGPAGAAIGGALGSAARGGNIGQIIQGAGAGYGAGSLLGAGSAALGASGANLAKGAAGPVTSFGGALQVGSNALLSGGSNIFKAAQGLSGLSNIAGGLFGASVPSMKQAANQDERAPIQKIDPLSRPSPMASPRSLSAMAGFDQMQTRSGLATQGVNRGLDEEEDLYYRNLIQRSLIGDTNQVAGNLNSLLPIESQYFSGRGGDLSSVENFLRQIRGY